MRPGLDFNPASLKIRKSEPLGNMKRKKTRGSAKKSREKATMEVNLSQQDVFINIEEQPIVGEDVMAGNTEYLTDHETMVEELFGYTAGPNKVLKMIVNEMRQQNIAEYPNDAVLEKYGLKMVRVKHVTYHEQIWIAFNNFFKFGLMPIPIHYMYHETPNGGKIPLPDCFTINEGMGFENNDSVRICFTDKNLTDTELSITVKVLELMDHMHTIAGETDKEGRTMNSTGKLLVDILKEWKAPTEWLYWDNLKDRDEELLKLHNLHEKYISAQQGRAQQSIRANGSGFVSTAIGMVSLPFNMVHSGKRQAESTATIVTELVESKFKEKLEESGRDFEAYDETIDETAQRLGITVEKAAEERKAYVYMFGDDSQFAKMSLVHTSLRASDKSTDITEALTRAGLPEGAQYRPYEDNNRRRQVKKIRLPHGQCVCDVSAKTCKGDTEFHVRAQTARRNGGYGTRTHTDGKCLDEIACKSGHDHEAPPGAGQADKEWQRTR